MEIAHNHRGKFIVIEGIDGSGKSVQTELLAQDLKRHGVPLHVTRECSDGPIGRLLREIYLPGNRDCDEHVINLLYAADRLDHISNHYDGMAKHIYLGTSVLCDRYVMSSLAYDTYMHIGHPAEYTEAMESIIARNKINMDLLTPDLTIVLGILPEAALKRINAGREEVSVYENLDKLTKIHQSYHNAIEILKHRYNNNIVVINADDSIENVHKKIWDIVAPHYPNL